MTHRTDEDRKALSAALDAFIDAYPEGVKLGYQKLLDQMKAAVAAAVGHKTAHDFALAAKREDVSFEALLTEAMRDKITRVRVKLKIENCGRIGVPIEDEDGAVRLPEL